MGTIGPAEILVVLLVALIVLGPERLPEAARQVGRFVSEVRRIGAGFQAELRDAVNTTVATPSTTAPTTDAGTPAPGAPPGPAPEVLGEATPPPTHPTAPDGLP